MTEITGSPWLARFQAVVRAQRLYLYVLLILCAFFWALRSVTEGGKNNTRIRLPIVDLDIEGLVVISVAPIAISFLLLAVLGTFPAATHAFSQLGLSRQDFEKFDTAPSSIDFALYSRKPRAWHRVGLLAYPILFTFVLAEAAWLWHETYHYPILAGRLVHVLGLVAMICCAPRLMSLWSSKVKQMIRGSESV